MTQYHTIDPTDVQHVLDSLDPGQPFIVIFLTKGNEQRRYTGTIEPGAIKSQSVAMVTSEGYKRFDLSRVLSINPMW